MWQIVENSWISDQDCQSVDHRGGEPYKTVGRERLTCPTINPSSRLMHVVVDKGYSVSNAPPTHIQVAWGHADHFEAASWNGPAHADEEYGFEETPKTREIRATSPRYG